MTPQRYKLINQDTRLHVCRQVMAADWGLVVTISEPQKSRDQEACYHAMIGDIAKQWEFMGQKWGDEDMKRILVDAFARVMREAGTPLRYDGRIVPSIDGTGFVQLGIQTRRFLKSEAAQFIEYLNAFGAENGIRFTAPRHEWEFA